MRGAVLKKVSGVEREGRDLKQIKKRGVQMRVWKETHYNQSQNKNKH